MEKNSKLTSQTIEIHFNSMWSLPVVPDYPTVGKSCCEIIRTPSLREIINTYAETGQIIVHTNVFPDDIPGDDSRLGDYDLVDAWHDAVSLEAAVSSGRASKKVPKETPKMVPKETPKEIPNETSKETSKET